jgi:hypothetical protein
VHWLMVHQIDRKNLPHFHWFNCLNQAQLSIRRKQFNRHGRQKRSTPAIAPIKSIVVNIGVASALLRARPMGVRLLAFRFDLVALEGHS